jgi:hypothetical protein
MHGFCIVAGRDGVEVHVEAVAMAVMLFGSKESTPGIWGWLFGL